MHADLLYLTKYTMILRIAFVQLLMERTRHEKADNPGTVMIRHQSIIYMAASDRSTKRTNHYRRFVVVAAQPDEAAISKVDRKLSNFGRSRMFHFIKNKIN